MLFYLYSSVAAGNLLGQGLTLVLVCMFAHLGSCLALFCLPQETQIIGSLGHSNPSKVPVHSGDCMLSYVVNVALLTSWFALSTRQVSISINYL